MQKGIQLNTELLRAIIRCSNYSTKYFFEAIGQSKYAEGNYTRSTPVFVSQEKLNQLEKSIENLLPTIVVENKFLTMLKVKISANALKAGWLGK